MGLGRRLLFILVGNMGFSRVFILILNVSSNIHQSFITTFQSNNIKILMNSPALLLILAFKITCILRSQIDRYDDQVL